MAPTVMATCLSLSDYSTPINNAVANYVLFCTGALLPLYHVTQTVFDPIQGRYQHAQSDSTVEHHHLAKERRFFFFCPFQLMRIQ